MRSRASCAHHDTRLEYRCSSREKSRRSRRRPGGHHRVREVGARAPTVLGTNPEVAVLCVDAMTVYRGMDIGTGEAHARPARAGRVPPARPRRTKRGVHALRVPTAPRARRRDVVWQRGGAVLYVGGTGLYARAVLDDFDIPRQYPEVRATLEAAQGRPRGSLRRARVARPARRESHGAHERTSHDEGTRGDVGQR